MLLSVIVPAYNEAQTLAEIIGRLRQVKFPVPCQIVIVNDGSRDGTLAAARQLAAAAPDRTVVVDQQPNQGKGAAIAAGIGRAQGDIIVIQDADLEYDPGQLPRLLAPLLDGRAKVVYGSRFLGRISGMSFGHRLGNRVLTWLTNLLFGCRLTDMETCYKVISREVVAGLKLEQKRFGIEVELTAKILRRGQRILELPIDYEARGKEAGKKIDWRDGLKAAGYLLRYRFF